MKDRATPVGGANNHGLWVGCRSRRGGGALGPGRRLATCWAVLLLALSTACQGEEALGEEEQTEDLTIVVEADKSRILQEEKALSERREAVESEHDRLKREREEIASKLASLSKKDRKTRERLETEQARLEQEEKQLRDRMNKFESERAKLEREKSQLLDRISSLTATKGGLTIEQREQRIAQRERSLAEREETLAKREAALAAREREATQTLQALNSVLTGLKDGGGTRTVIVNSPAAPPAGAAAATASRGQAVRAQRAARAKMEAKGILMDDLPPTAKSRLEEGNRALGAKEYAEAVIAYEEVQSYVDGISVDQGFLNGKMKRINRAVGKLDDNKKQKVMPLLLEMGDAFSNGRYDRANKKANQIVSVLRTN